MKKKGGILIITLWIIAILGMIVATMHFTMTREYQIAKMKEASVRSYYLAESGISLAMECLRNDRINLSSLYAQMTNQLLINEIGVVGIYGSGSDGGTLFNSLFADVDNTANNCNYSQFIELYNDSNDTIDLSDYWIETDNDMDRTTQWNTDYRYRKGFYMYDIRSHTSSDWIGSDGYENYRTTKIPPRSFALVLPAMPNNSIVKTGIFSSIIPDNCIVARINQGTYWFHDPSTWSIDIQKFLGLTAANDNPNGNSDRIWMYDNVNSLRPFYMRLVKKSNQSVIDAVYIEGNNYWTSGADRCVSFGRPSLHQGFFGTAIGLTPNSYNCFVWNGGSPYWIVQSDTWFRYGSPGSTNFGQAASDVYLVDSNKSFTGTYKVNTWIEGCDNTGRYFKLENISDADGNELGSCTVYILDEKSKFHLNYKPSSVQFTDPLKGLDNGAFNSINSITENKFNPYSIKSIILGLSTKSNYMKYVKKPYSQVDKIDYCLYDDNGNYQKDLFKYIYNYFTVYPVNYYNNSYSNKMMYPINWNTAADTVLKGCLNGLLSGSSSINFILSEWNSRKNINPFDGLDENGDILTYYGISGNNPWVGVKKEYFDFIDNLNSALVPARDKSVIKWNAVRGNSGIPPISFGPEYMQTQYLYSYYTIIAESSIPVRFFGNKEFYKNKIYCTVKIEDTPGNVNRQKITYYKWFDSFPY
ncbi:hypothetical protein KA977_07405 [Candidatus Dependentiae bacterium]|nr:hypothetical protein [Candidatus Dependentiae bacterium]